MNDISVYNKELISDEGIDGFTSIEIFSTGGTDEVWGNSDKNCNPFSFSSYDASIDYTFTNASYDKINDTIKVDLNYDLPSVRIKDRKGIDKNSLHLKTFNSFSCEWIGMGIGWDSWQAKDLSGIMNNAAIEFVARVDGDSLYNLPIVFILEDYSANQCYATASYLGIDGGVITNKWTKVIIPLATFSYQTNNIDLTNIKQLLLQCYDNVDVYIDDIKIISHQHSFRKMSPSLTVKDSIMPIDIFSEKLNASWGIGISHCDNIILNTDTDYNGGVFIDVKMDKNKCNWNQFAISWNRWLYTDLSNVIYGVFLDFDVQLYEHKNTRISIEDYDGKKMSVDLKDYIKKDELKWQKIRIPIKDFPIRSSSINLERIKDIIFTFEDNAQLKIDNIKLTN